MESLRDTKLAVEIEGELKHIKSFWSSSKDFYRLRYPHMLIARESKEPTKAKFEIAYDLRVYNVLLGSDDSKLLLTPKDEKLNAQKVELVAETQNGTK